MKIQNLQANGYNINNKLHFKSNVRNVGEIYNTTIFFRKDLPWVPYIDMLGQKYRDSKNVNINILGCSSGEEAISKAMLLIKRLGEKASAKFFPINASDIDSDILKNPQQGIVKVSKEEIERLKSILGDDYKKFIELNYDFEQDPFLNSEVCTGILKPILKDKIIFKQSNAIDEVKNLSINDTITWTRNFLSYISHSKQIEIIKGLSEHLGNNSMCVIGSLDVFGWNRIRKSKAHYIFEAHGAQKLFGNHLCYAKPENTKEKYLFEDSDEVKMRIIERR